MTDQRGSITKDDNPSSINQYTGGGGKKGAAPATKGGVVQTKPGPDTVDKLRSDAGRHANAASAASRNFRDAHSSPTDQKGYRAQSNHNATISANHATKQALEKDTSKAHYDAAKEHRYAAGAHERDNAKASDRHTKAEEAHMKIAGNLKAMRL